MQNIFFYLLRTSLAYVTDFFWKQQYYITVILPFFSYRFFSLISFFSVAKSDIIWNHDKLPEWWTSVPHNIFHTNNFILEMHSCQNLHPPSWDDRNVALPQWYVRKRISPVIRTEGRSGLIFHVVLIMCI